MGQKGKPMKSTIALFWDQMVVRSTSRYASLLVAATVVGLYHPCFRRSRWCSMRNRFMYTSILSCPPRRPQSSAWIHASIEAAEMLSKTCL